MEVYIDDIIVKSRKADQLFSNLEAAFTRLREFRIKLNPKKCMFGVPKEKLLRFIISERGIEANPEKITAIENLGPITNLKGVQKFMGCLASVSHFISWLGECGMPLYKLLKKANQFTWTAEAQEAFEKLIAQEGRTTPLHRCDHSGGQRDVCHRARRKRALPQDLEASILHQRGSLRHLLVFINTHRKFRKHTNIIIAFT
jgi:hypothetical protein